MQAAAETRAPSSAPRIRVLHVLGSLRPGGVETWLVHVLRHLDRERFHFDFLLHDTGHGLLEADVAALGARIHRCPHVGNPPRYARCFRRVLARCGPYRAVHSHVHAFSGYVLALAASSGVPLRIAHSHTTAESPAFLRSPARWCYASAMRRAISRLATHGLACASAPAQDLFGPRWRDDPRWQVLRCGVDPADFESVRPFEADRASLGLDREALVVGHVGNFHAVKNHAFLIRVFRALLEIHPRSYLVCVGDGPLREAVEREARAMRLEDRVLLLGPRRDVPALMRGVFDVLALPSRSEGLPLALVEAQAARLPCVVSDAVTTEADVRGASVARLALDEPVETWAGTIVSAGLAGRAAPRAGRSPVAGTEFDVAIGARRLESLYCAGGAAW